MRNQTSFRLTTTLLPTDTTAKTTQVKNKVDADGNQFYPTFSEETVVLTNDDRTVMETTRASCSNWVLTFIKRGLSDDSSATVVDNRKLTWNPWTLAFITAWAWDWIDKDDDLTWTGTQTYSGNATFNWLLTTNKWVKYPSFADVEALNAYANPFAWMFAVVESTWELYRYNAVTEEWSLISTAEISEDIIEFIRDIMDWFTMPYIASKVVVWERYTASDKVFIQYAPKADDCKMAFPVGDAAARTQIHIQRASSGTESNKLKLKMRKVWTPTSKVVVEIKKGTVVNDTNEDYWYGDGATIATAELPYSSFTTDRQELTFTTDVNFGGWDKELLSVVVHQQEDIVNASNYYEIACDITQYSEWMRAVCVKDSSTRTTTKVMPYCDSNWFEKCMLAKQDDTLYSMPYKYPVLENINFENKNAQWNRVNAIWKPLIPICATSIEVTWLVGVAGQTINNRHWIARIYNGRTAATLYDQSTYYNDNIDQTLSISENDSLVLFTGNNYGNYEAKFTNMCIYALNWKISKSQNWALAVVSEVTTVWEEVDAITEWNEWDKYFVWGIYNPETISLDYTSTWSTDWYCWFEAPLDWMLITGIGSSHVGSLVINWVSCPYNTAVQLKKWQTVSCFRSSSDVSEQTGTVKLKFISN